MSYSTFGYDGVLQASENLVNKLLNSEFYERNLVRIGTTVKDDEFVIIPIEAGGIHITVYLLVGRPELSFRGFDGSNKIELTIPLFAISVYIDDGNGISRKNLGLGDSSLGMTVRDITLVKTSNGLLIDLSAVKDTSIDIYSFLFISHPDNVGGKAHGKLDLTEQIIDQTLTTAGTGLKAVDIKKAIADKLKGNFLTTTKIPIEPGGQFSALGDWDLMTFDSAIDGDSDALDAGASLLLFKSAGVGQGTRTDATDVIPLQDSGPSYRWAACLRADMILDGMKKSMNRGAYAAQNSGTLNTAASPYGHMVVPPLGQRNYSLPPAANVIVKAPANGSVDVNITGFSPNGRGTIEVSGAGTVRQFAAGGDGIVNISINAANGDRLTITVDAISTPDDSSIIIWRPELSFVEGGIRADFHFYKFIDNWCDAEGDGYVIANIFADRFHTFQIGVEAGDNDFDLPWWSYVVAWGGGELIFGLVGFVVSEILLATVVKDYIRDEINFPEIIKKFGQVDELSKAPSLPGAAIFLDKVEVITRGLTVSGMADSGQVVSYGRKAAFSSVAGTILQSPSLRKDVAPSFYNALDWQPAVGAVTITTRGHNRIISNDAVNQFWEMGYDDLLPIPQNNEPLTLSPGQSAMLVIDDHVMLTKILLERYMHEADVLNPTLLVTWIAYQKRVSQSIRLIDEVKFTIVSSSESSTIIWQTLTYDGIVSLRRTKFFLTGDTEHTGQEIWIWDGETVTEQGILFPGGSVSIVPGAHALAVKIDQTNVQDLTDSSFVHFVEFNGTDVFGRMQKAKLTLSTPSRMILPKRISSVEPGVTRSNPLGPLINPVRFRDRAFALAAHQILSRQLIGPEYRETINTLVTSLEEGSAVLNSNTAAIVLDLLMRDT